MAILNPTTAIFFFQSFQFIIFTESFLTCLTLCAMNKTLIFHLTYDGNNMTHVNVFNTYDDLHTNKWIINWNEFKLEHQWLEG